MEESDRIEEHLPGPTQDFSIAPARTLDRQLVDLDKRLDRALLEHGTTLTELDGVGVILAARVLAHTGPVSRFASLAHYASYAGVAPVEVASGQSSRQRLSRAGNRRLNCAIHLSALPQVRHNRARGRVSGRVVVSPMAIRPLVVTSA